MITVDDVHIKYPEQRADAQAFVDLVHRWRFLNWVRPAPVSSPWHWLAWGLDANGYKVEVNFWPHKAKYQVQYQKARGGWPQAEMALTKLFIHTNPAANGDHRDMDDMLIDLDDY